jgi:hypothetical protein
LKWTPASAAESGLPDATSPLSFTAWRACGAGAQQAGRVGALGDEAVERAVEPGLLAQQRRPDHLVGLDGAAVATTAAASARATGRPSRSYV